VFLFEGNVFIKKSINVDVLIPAKGLCNRLANRIGNQQDGGQVEDTVSKARDSLVNN